MRNLPRLISIALIGATIGFPSFAHAQTAAPPPATTTTVPSDKSPTAAAKPLPPAKADIMDINTATKEQLMTLEGIGEVRADAIINGRPYKNKKELADKNIVPAKVYQAIKGQIVAKHQTAGKSSAKTAAPAAPAPAPVKQ